MSALIPEEFIAVGPTLVRHFNPVGAIVLQQIHFVGGIDYFGGEFGECRLTYQKLADKTGLSKDGVYRAVKRLVEAGVVEIVDREPGGIVTLEINHDKLPDPPERPSRNRRAGSGAVAKSPTQVGDIATGRRDIATAQALSPGETQPLRSRRTREEGNEPPNPPQAGGADPTLFVVDSPDGGIESAAERRHQTDAEDRGAEALFADWWEHYPNDVRKGPRKTALRAWKKALQREHLTVAILTERRDRMAELRRRWSTHHSLPIEEAPLPHASTFINSKHDEYAGPISPSMVAGWWPGPKKARAAAPVDPAVAEIRARREAKHRAEAEEAERRRVAGHEHAILFLMEEGHSREAAEAMVEGQAG
jgi:hypothetical protein